MKEEKRAAIAVFLNKIFPAAALLLGLFSTMPVLGVVVRDRDVSFYRILFALALLFLGICFLMKPRLKLGKKSLWLELWLFVGLIGCVCGMLFLNGPRAEWGQAARSYIPKVILLLAFCFLWQANEEADPLAEWIMRGFLLGCALNCLWATIDAVGFYATGKSLNNILFYNYCVRNDIREHTLSLIFHGSIRSGGFNSDPAQLGFVAPVLFGYGLARKKPLPVFLSICGIAASASTTGLVSAVLLLVFLLRPRSKDGTQNKFSKADRWMLAILCALIALVLLLQGDRILPLAQDILHRFAARIQSSYLNNNGPDIRVRYVLQAPFAMRAVLPFMLFGSGFGTASLGYATTPEVLAVIGQSHDFAYDMENTFLAYIFDTGVVGFALYLITMGTLLFAYRKKYAARESAFAQSVYITVCVSLLSMLFYHYILFAPQMMIFTIALSRLDREAEAA